MKKIILIIALSILYSAQILSQDGYRIKLLTQLNPHPVSGQAYSALWGYRAPDGREYAILGCSAGTSFVDITDSTDIHEVDYLPVPQGVQPSGWREMKTYSHYAYIVSEAPSSCIQIADLSYLPDSVRYVGKISLPDHSTTHTISQSGPYLYLNGCNAAMTQGIAIVDLSVNPEAPVLRGKWNGLYVHDSRIINDTIWACNIANGKVSIIDARDKDNPVTIRDWVNSPQPNAPHNIALSNDRRYAFVTDEVFSPPGRLKIWNVSDLNNITYISSFDPTPFEGADVHNIEIQNNFAVLAYYAAGVKVLDISNPVNPVEIGWYDTYPENNLALGCWAVYIFESGKIIASDMYSGLYVLRPDLSIPVASMPHVNFSVPQNSVSRRDSIRLIDMTEGVPSNYLWTVSGPQTKTSTLRHPKFAFDSLGSYSVKLFATNSFGSDSLIRTNVFQVTPVALPSFGVETPVNLTVYNTSPADTGKYFFNWNKPLAGYKFSYRLTFKKTINNYEVSIPSGNNGNDSFAFVTGSKLDSIARQLDPVADSIVCHFKVRAHLVEYSTTSNSVLIYLKRSKTGIYTLSSEIPLMYSLSNNYPNPFNPSTKIRFEIPSSSDNKINATVLEVFDISGRKVAELVNAKLQPGIYIAEFNSRSENLSSGVYLYRIKSGEFVQTKRMVLLK